MGDRREEQEQEIDCLKSMFPEELKGKVIMDIFSQ